MRRGEKAESCNSETASGDQAMKQQCGERQASLKPALRCIVVLQLRQMCNVEVRKVDFTKYPKHVRKTENHAWQILELTVSNAS